MKISNALYPDNPRINYEVDDKDRFVERKGTWGIRYRTWDVYFQLPRIILSNCKTQKKLQRQIALERQISLVNFGNSDIVLQAAKSFLNRSSFAMDRKIIRQQSHPSS